MRREREFYDSGTPWERFAGYSRAIRVGRRIYVSGTTATAEDGSICGGDDAYAQTLQVIRNIETALLKLGSSLWDVVRTRMYVTDISRWEEVARAHGECFAKIRPATSLVEVKSLILPEMLVEIEAVADIPEGRGR